METTDQRRQGVFGTVSHHGGAGACGHRKTLTQLPNVKYVGITVEDSQLYDNAGEMVGWMNADQFINNDGNEINTYELVKVKLYFANAAGDKLIASYREKHYSTNTPLERFVVED